MAAKWQVPFVWSVFFLADDDFSELSLSNSYSSDEFLPNLWRAICDWNYLSFFRVYLNWDHHDLCLSVLVNTPGYFSETFFRFFFVSRFSYFCILASKKKLQKWKVISVANERALVGTRGFYFIGHLVGLSNKRGENTPPTPSAYFVSNWADKV